MPRLFFRIFCLCSGLLILSKVSYGYTQYVQSGAPFVDEDRSLAEDECKTTAANDYQTRQENCRGWSVALPPPEQSCVCTYHDEVSPHVWSCIYSFTFMCQETPGGQGRG